MIAWFLAIYILYTNHRVCVYVRLSGTSNFTALSPIFMYTTLYQSGNMFEQYYRGPLPTYERSELASKAKGHSDEKSNGREAIRHLDT